MKRTILWTLGRVDKTNAVMEVAPVAGLDKLIDVYPEFNVHNYTPIAQIKIVQEGDELVTYDDLTKVVDDVSKLSIGFKTSVAYEKGKTVTHTNNHLVCLGIVADSVAPKQKTFEEYTLGVFNPSNSDYFAELYYNRSFRPQVVVCAANRDKATGQIICGVRHWDGIMHATANAIVGDARNSTDFQEQGFVDQYGNFLTRKQAKIIARRMGQITPERDCGQDELYSEELY